MALSRFQNSQLDYSGTRNVGDDHRGLKIFGNSNDVTDNSLNTLKELGINTEQPIHVQFAVLTVRIGTFTSSWNRRQSPTSMAEAGFFYSGQSDIVFCFFCGQGLQNWDPYDIPFEEHARWSPKCVFLQNIKGKDYIGRIQQKYNRQDTHSESCSYAAHTAIKEFTEGDVPREKLFSTPAIQSLLENGYDKNIVDTALTVWIKQNERRDFSSSDILQIIFELEEGNIKPETIVQNKSDQNQSEKDIQEQLRAENAVLKQAILCRICKTEPVCVANLPCGHLSACEVCAPAMKNCPICKVFVKGTIKTFLV